MKILDILGEALDIDENGSVEYLKNQLSVHQKELAEYEAKRHTGENVDDIIDSIEQDIFDITELIRHKQG